MSVGMQFITLFFGYFSSFHSKLHTTPTNQPSSSSNNNHNRVELQLLLAKNDDDLDTSISLSSSSLSFYGAGIDFNVKSLLTGTIFYRIFGKILHTKWRHLFLFCLLFIGSFRVCRWWGSQWISFSKATKTEPQPLNAETFIYFTFTM